jgi:putative ABC transport system ATP-binding protein
MDLLVRLNRELDKTLLMVTHDAKCAAHAESVLHLEKGRLVEAVRRTEVDHARA